MLLSQYPPLTCKLLQITPLADNSKTDKINVLNKIETNNGLTFGSVSTVQVISEMIFSANHLTGTKYETSRQNAGVD